MADGEVLNGGNPGGGNTGAPGANGGNPNPNPSSGAPADKGVGGTGGTGGTGNAGFTFKEDRSDWVPRHRLNETSGKLTAAETRAIKAETDLAAEQRRTRALAGVEPQDPKAAEAESIRGVLQDMFPQLKALEGLTKDQLQEVMEAAQSARHTSQASWQRHTVGVLGDLDAEAATTLGVDKLTATQQARLRQAYREEALQASAVRQQAVKRGERDVMETLSTDNDFIARHERADKTLIKEFVKAYLDDWYEPARRSVTAAQARRFRPLPKGERTRQSLTQGAAKVDLNNEGEFKKALLAARGASQD